MAFFSGLSTCFPFGEAGAFGVFRGARLRMRGREYPQSFAWRMTAPSAEGAKGDFASAEARRWTEPVWQLSDRPATPSARFLTNLVVIQRWQVAAALSAAVTITKQQGTPPTFRRNQLCRSNLAKRQPLFGRGGLGERRFSQRSGLSPRISPPSHLLQSSNFCDILEKSKIVRL